MVNLVLIPKFIAAGWQVIYIGSEDGIEKELIAPLSHVTYYSIATGKLRRYFDWNNFKDPFRVLKGVLQAYRIIKKEKPQVLFSKGGFVSVPVIVAARLNKVPVIAHESDYTPGLANKLSTPFVTTICVTFSETLAFLPKGKAQYVGAIVREELLRGSKKQGLAMSGFVEQKPVLLIMGGSLGARAINEVVRRNLATLLKQFQIVHLCGKGNVVSDLESREYRQFEYVDAELPHMLAMADIVLSRAGANAIFEFLALQKPMLLIPLSKNASRGDQILNARSFAREGYAKVMEEEVLSDALFLDTIFELYANRASFVERMANVQANAAVDTVILLIEQHAK